MPESGAPVDTPTAGIAGDAEGEKEREAKGDPAYILLHRSRSHHFDLRAELAEWRGADGSLRVKTDDIFSLRRRYDVLMQVAVSIS